MQLAWKWPNFPDRAADSWFGEHQRVNWQVANNVLGDYEICALSYGTLFPTRNGGTQHVGFSLHLKRSPGLYVLKGILLKGETHKRACPRFSVGGGIRSRVSCSGFS